MGQLTRAAHAQTIKCEVVVRRFDDAQKKLGGGKGQGQQGQQGQGQGQWVPQPPSQQPRRA